MNNQMDKTSRASHLGHSDSILYLPQQEHQQQTQTSQLATTTSQNQVKKPISFPFGKCRICRDKATGVHYGVITCEGCKGFFKRSITQGVPYRCFFGDTCVINMKTRNRCKACRLKLCFERGMAMESVKMGRIPKKVKEKALKNYEKYQEKLRQNRQTALQEVPDERSSGLGESEDSGIENGSLSSRNRESVSSISSYSSSNMSNIGSQQCSYYNQESVNIPPNLFNESEEPFCTVDLIQLTVATSSLHVNNVDHNLSTLRLPSVFSESNTLPKTYPDILKPAEPSLSMNTKQMDQIAMKSTVKNYMTVATYISEVNENSLIDYMFNYEIRFSKNVLQIMRYLSQKLSQPFLIYELDFEVTSFFRYLRWKMLNSYLKHTKRLRALIERMFGIINLGITNYPGSHATVTQIWEDIQKSISVDVTHLMTFARDMPGLNELNTNDFTRILNNRVFDFYIIYNYPLFYKNESYTMTINGFQYSRHFMNQIIGKKTTDALHEFSAKLHTLNITQVEHSLIIPIILGLADEKIVDSESVYFIKYCFMYALYIQLCTTRTEDEAKFVFEQILQLVDSIETINKLCKENIGALVLDKTLSQK